MSSSANDSTTACVSTLSIWGGPQHPPPPNPGSNSPLHCPCSDLLSRPHGTRGWDARGSCGRCSLPRSPRCAPDPRVPAVPAGAVPPHGRQVAPWPRGEEAPAPPPPPQRSAPLLGGQGDSLPQTPARESGGCGVFPPSPPCGPVRVSPRRISVALLAPHPWRVPTPGGGGGAKLGEGQGCVSPRPVVLLPTSPWGPARSAGFLQPPDRPPVPGSRAPGHRSLPFPRPLAGQAGKCFHQLPAASHLQELTQPQGRQPLPAQRGEPQCPVPAGATRGTPVPKGWARHEKEGSWTRWFHLGHLLLLLRGKQGESGVLYHTVDKPFVPEASMLLPPQQGRQNIQSSVH